MALLFHTTVAKTAEKPCHPYPKNTPSLSIWPSWLCTVAFLIFCFFFSERRKGHLFCLACNLQVIYDMHQHHPAFQKQHVLSVQETKWSFSVSQSQAAPYLPKHRLFEGFFLQNKVHSVKYKLHELTVKRISTTLYSICKASSVELGKSYNCDFYYFTTISYGQFFPRNHTANL